jgi:hypothetical protein
MGCINLARRQQYEWLGWLRQQRNAFDNQNAPDGTYYYVIELNDSEYPIPLVGFLYLSN